MIGGMTIGQLGMATGLAPSALRFYEERHLLEPAARTEAGYRLYNQENLARVRFIRNAQTLGLSLDEIRELLRANDSNDPVPTRDRLRHMVAHKLSVVRRQIDDQHQFLDQLEEVYHRLEQDPKECVCTHLGSCDCLTIGIADGDRRQMDLELKAIDEGCSCGCGGDMRAEA